MRLLYVECGTTLNSKVNSGIQRVVKNILREAEDIASKNGMRCIPVCFTPNGFIPIAEMGKYHDLLPSKNVLMYCERLIVRIDFFEIYSSVRPFIKKAWNLFAGFTSREKSASFLKPINDSNIPSVLLLLDSTWNTQMWPLLDSFRSEGGRVGAVLYDLIPFIHPDTVDRLTHQAYTSWWGEATNHLDMIFCISRSVKEEFLNWQDLQEGLIKIPPEKVRYFYLGADLNIVDPVIRILSEEIPYVLAVGSLEPRKNYESILTAFDLLWKSGSSVRLAIVGGYGWKNENLLQRIQNHPELNKRLFLIRDATDRDLSSLYRSASFVVFASIAEGFGLPIVEAFQYGTPVICSDIPVFREIAKDRAIYFDPLKPDDLAKKIDLNLRHTVLNIKKISDFKWCSWSESCNQLMASIKELLDEDNIKSNNLSNE